MRQWAWLFSLAGHPFRSATVSFRVLACETSAQSVGGWGCHRPAEERGQYRPAEWEGLLQSVGGRGCHRPAEWGGGGGGGGAVNLEAVRGRGCCSQWVGGAATGLLRRGASTGLLRGGLVQSGGGWEGLLLSSKSATSEAGG